MITSAVEQAGTGGESVLIVDDDPRMRSALRHLLESQGHRTFEAADGHEGAELAQQLRPDVILTDVDMPGRNGHELLAHVKGQEELRTTAVIFITGRTDRQDRLRCLAEGCDGFVSKPIDPEEVTTRVRVSIEHKRVLDRLEAPERVLTTMANLIEARESETGQHCQRLSHHSALIRKAMGLPEKSVRALHVAGILHDIGKVAIPDSILLKPGPLTYEERLVMQSHAERGAELCEPLRSLEDVIPIIRHHHERLDGSGYPDGLVGDEIPLTARILQAVDVFDALLSPRPYKPALRIEAALEILRSEVERGWYDPVVFGHLEEMVRTGQWLMEPDPKV